eukprot:UN32900
MGKIEELLNAVEVLKGDRDLKEIPLHFLKHREYQFKCSIDEKCWRSVVVSGNNSLHDLSRVCMVIFNWIPNMAGKYKYKSNKGQPFGEFKCREEITERITNRTSLQNICLAEVFEAVNYSIIWKYGDKTIKISCQGVTPSRDKIVRGLPRCVGGEVAAPPHVDALKRTWKSKWDTDTLLEINELFLGDRFVRDGFKTYSEFSLDKSSALRRCAPFLIAKEDY